MSQVESNSILTKIQKNNLLKMLNFEVSYFQTSMRITVVFRPVGTRGARGHVPTQYLEPLVVK